MKANQAIWLIVTMARLLAVSASGFYAWLERKPSAHARRDADLLSRIRAIYTRSRGTYGMPRIHAEVAEQGIHVGRKRVARLMRIAGLRGVSRRRWISTTQRQPDARPAPDRWSGFCTSRWCWTCSAGAWWAGAPLPRATRFAEVDLHASVNS